MLLAGNGFCGAGLVVVVDLVAVGFVVVTAGGRGFVGLVAVVVKPV